ncbi:MAG: hypothetical protein ACO1O1_13730 [Adhaeribacter sp.]
MKLAIITGDLIDSSKYSPEQRERAGIMLKQTLEEERRLGNKSWLKYEMFRGDSAQIEVLRVEKALSLAILLRAALKQLPDQAKHPDPGQHPGREPVLSSKPFADIRLSIGIGEAEFKHARIVESDGEAYRLSGRSLDRMKKKGQKLILQSADENFNQEYEVQCRLLDVIIDKWSTSSAEVVFWLLKGLKDIEIADKLGISQPAISSRKKAAGWEAIDLMIQGFERKITKNLQQG